MTLLSNCGHWDYNHRMLGTTHSKSESPCAPSHGYILRAHTSNTHLYTYVSETPNYFIIKYFIYYIIKKTLPLHRQPINEPCGISLKLVMNVISTLKSNISISIFVWKMGGGRYTSNLTKILPFPMNELYGSLTWRSSSRLGTPMPPSECALRDSQKGSGKNSVDNKLIRSFLPSSIFIHRGFSSLHPSTHPPT